MIEFVAARKFVIGEEGATMVEYGLMLVLIAVVCFASVALVGTKASTMWSNVSSSL